MLNNLNVANEKNVAASDNKCVDLNSGDFLITLKSLYQKKLLSYQRCQRTPKKPPIVKKDQPNI